VDVLNLFNANSVLRINDRYGASWQNVLQVLTGRLIKVGAQFDF
jgi:predicted 3-demethylubiquinone-9 3-methyltransferase (glyoxalase superfamily)